MWQVSGAHGRIDRERALDSMDAHGAILGRRLGLTDQRADNARVFAFGLHAEDLARIDAVLARSRDLFAVIGDCGDEYR